MSREICKERMEEIATMALNKLAEWDRDMSHQFMLDEMDMSAEEAEYFGVDRNRIATDISWDEDDETYRENLPTEVVIPWDVKDDDISYHLESEYGCNVLDVDVDEDYYYGRYRR